MNILIEVCIHISIINSLVGSLRLLRFNLYLVCDLEKNMYSVLFILRNLEENEVNQLFKRNSLIYQSTIFLPAIDS
jgi:hypothetical protein